MPVRFYKKLSPATKVVLGNNTHCDFTSLDTLTGYFATGSEYVQSEFERAMRENRYGITEITQEEFHRDYVEKKNTTNLNLRSREEISGSGYRRNLIDQLGASHVENAVGVKPPAQVAITVAESAPGTVPVTAPVTSATPQKPADFKPTVGKRPKRNIAQ